MLISWGLVLAMFTQSACILVVNAWMQHPLISNQVGALVRAPTLRELARAGATRSQADVVHRAALRTVPNVPILFGGFRVMVLIGLCLLALYTAALILHKRVLADAHRRLLVMVPCILPLPWLASTSGWIVAEMGRQPWVVYGYLPTLSAPGPRRAAPVGLLVAADLRPRPGRNRIGAAPVRPRSRPRPWSRQRDTRPLRGQHYHAADPTAGGVCPAGKKPHDRQGLAPCQRPHKAAVMLLMSLRAVGNSTPSLTGYIFCIAFP